MRRFMSHQRRSLTLPLLLAGCGALQISGAAAPTDDTFKLTAEDIAYVEADACAQTWVTGDASADLATAHKMLADRGVKIVPGNPIATATALARKLRVSAEFHQYSDEEQVVLLSHELVHYCHRDEQGDSAFEASYLNSAGRWRTETGAYLQGFRTMLLLCAPVANVEAAIESRLKTMRDKYLLWDIDPEQYIAETRRIWQSVSMTPTRCATGS